MDNVMQEMVLPTRKETLVDQIHDKILEIIIQEDVSEKSVFTEGKLVQQFQVSKATVREALVLSLIHIYLKQKEGEEIEKEVDCPFALPCHARGYRSRLQRRRHRFHGRRRHCRHSQ